MAATNGDLSPKYSETRKGTAPLAVLNQTVSLCVVPPWRGNRIFDAKLKPAHGSRKGPTIPVSRPVMPSSLTNGRLWRRAPQRVPSDRKLILAGSRVEGMLACAFRPGRAPRFALLAYAGGN
jgi:hypothetical protein